MDKTRDELRERSPLEQAQDAAAQATDAGKNAGGAIVGAGQSARDAASQVLRSASDKASNVAASTKETASNAFEYGKEKLASIAGTNGDESPQQKKDEVDLTPEEQLTRHHVELDTDKLPSHHHTTQHRGHFQQLKEKAAHVAVAARSTLSSLKHSGDEDDAPSSNDFTGKERKHVEERSNYQESGRKPANVDNTEGVPWGGPPVPSTQKNIRGQQENDQRQPAGTDENEVPYGGPPVPSTEDTARKKAGMSGGDKNDFPETLQDAINGAGMNKGPESEIEKEKKQQGNDVEGEGSGANPFGLTAGARSKL